MKHPPVPSLPPSLLPSRVLFARRVFFKTRWLRRRLRLGGGLELGHLLGDDRALLLASDHDLRGLAGTNKTRLEKKKKKNVGGGVRKTGKKNATNDF